MVSSLAIPDPVCHEPRLRRPPVPAGTGKVERIAIRTCLSLVLALTHYSHMSALELL